MNGGAPFIDYSSGGTIVAWDKTIEEALKYDVDAVIPGHGPVAKKADLMKWRDKLATLRSRAKEACAGGAEGALKSLNLQGLEMQPSALFERSMPGMCQELSR